MFLLMRNVYNGRREMKWQTIYTYMFDDAGVRNSMCFIVVVLIRIINRISFVLFLHSTKANNPENSKKNKE